MVIMATAVDVLVAPTTPTRSAALFVLAAAPLGHTLPRLLSSADFPDVPYGTCNASGAWLVHRHGKPMTVSARPGQAHGGSSLRDAAGRRWRGPSHSGTRRFERLSPQGDNARLGVNLLTS